MATFTATFLTSATNLQNLPKSQLPEVAFIGRSNVGKSSLINALTKNAKLAKISKTPGRTQQINFFQAQGLMIVDLPGYGFAKAPKAEVEKWHSFNSAYLKNRTQLKVVILLIDSRIGIGPLDLNMLQELQEYGVNCQIIYTKADKLTKAELNILQSVTVFNDMFSILATTAIISSSKSKEGIDKLCGLIKSIMRG